MSAIYRTHLAALLLLSCAATAAGQVPGDATARIDAVVAAAYKAATATLPCKVSTSKGRMLDWKEVDKCMERARQAVDWDELSGQLQKLRQGGVSAADLAAAVESSLDRYALPYNQVFRVKNPQTLLPLTNSILKYAPDGVLMDQPVFMQQGKQPVGVFAGAFFYDRAGSITGTNYRLTLFQYRDADGRMQTPAERLLLDTYGVAWEKVEARPGFRFPVEMIPGFGNK
jgi:hypothetical protein